MMNFKIYAVCGPQSEQAMRRYGGGYRSRRIADIMILAPLLLLMCSYSFFATVLVEFSRLRRQNA